ncbi:MAG: NADH-quinone oxidoreductase subunit D [Bdellovibrionota bacterium]
MTTPETLGTDLSQWEIGPHHGALSGGMRLKMQLDGEIIAAAPVEVGFLHKGLEKCLEMQRWSALIPFLDHLDPEGAVFGEYALCAAVEDVAKIEVPARAQTIRVIVCELTRIACHLAYLARVAKAAGSATMAHFALRDREKILDLFELLTGARFSHNYLSYGGVREDVTDGFIERVVEICHLIRIRLKEYNDLFTYNQIFLERSKQVGVISPENIRALGITGPNARASGYHFDVRKAHPYSSYQNYDFEVPLGSSAQFETGGDIHARFLVRLREIAASIEILRQACEHLPRGAFTSRKFDKNFIAPTGEAFARVESSRGLLACHLVSDGKARPHRVQFRTPSAANIMAVPRELPGSRIQDLPLILASLDICIAEVDR